MSENYEQAISKFIELKFKIGELEDRYEKYRKIVEEYMIKENITSLEHNQNNQTYKIKKSVLSRESISKKELPKEIWDKYSKSSSYTTLRISKKNIL